MVNLPNPWCKGLSKVMALATILIESADRFNRDRIEGKHRYRPSHIVAIFRRYSNVSWLVSLVDDSLTWASEKLPIENGIMCADSVHAVSSLRHLLAGNFSHSTKSYKPESIHLFPSRFRQAAFNQAWSLRFDDSISDKISSILSSAPNRGDITAGVCGWAFTVNTG